MSMKIIAPIAAGVLLAMAGAAQAATKTDGFNVTATVAKNCSINATDMGFGSFDLDDVTDRSATSSIVVRCTKGTAYTVLLSTGGAPDYTTRLMSNGTDTLAYNLYVDSAVTAAIWGDGTGSTSVVGGSGDGMGTTQARTITVHGRVPALGNEDATPGDYTDSIIATVSY